MARTEGERRAIIVPGTSVRLGPDGDTVFRERSWNSRDHIHIGPGSARRTRQGRIVRYLEDAGNSVKGVSGVQKEDKQKGFPW